MFDSYELNWFITDHHTLLALFFGVILDRMIGDPDWLPHPVRWIGAYIHFWDRELNRPGKTKKSLFFRGLLLVLLVLLTVLFITGLLCLICYGISPFLGLAAESLLAFWVISAKDLKEESMAVCEDLLRGDTKQAERDLSMIVGRDTASLNEDGMIRAAVETVAENTTDGVIAPMLFLLLGGGIPGMLYKAVNTMDSMIGYRNPVYLYFGKAAARLDDILNYIPAWISAFFMTAAAFLLGYDGRSAFRVFWQDRKKSASPNAGKTESVMSGALHIALGGDAFYGGELYQKPFIGLNEETVSPIPEDIEEAGRLMGGTQLLFAAVIAAVVLLTY